KEQAGGGEGLPDGLGLPMLLELDVQEVVAELGFGNCGWITAEILVNQSYLPVVGVPGAIGIVTESEQVGQLGHRLVRMLVIDGIGIVSSRGPNAGEVGPRLTAWGHGRW